MPLINLTTNLRGLGFGSDRPAQGNSSQPYMPVDIPDGISFGRSGLPTLPGPDFILRGGLTAPGRALTDVRRLAKYFVDGKSPSGILFAVKQNLLSRMGVKTQASQGIGTAGGILNEGIYTPIGTVLSAGFSWVGLRVNKQGLDPTGLSPASILTYSDVVKNNTPSGLSRLSFFQKKKSLRTGDPGQSIGTFGNDGFVKYKIPVGTESNVLYDYGGGPNSILGISRTKIRMETPTYNAIRGKLGVEGSNLLGGRDMDSFALKTYSNMESVRSSFLMMPGDFRKEILTIDPKRQQQTETDDASEKKTEVISKVIGKPFAYKTVNRDTMFGRGQLKSNVYNWDAPASASTALDRLTAQPMYEDSTPKNYLGIQDIMNFRIAAIKNNDGQNAVYLHFRAYLESFGDSYGATWNPVQYVGRAESFFNYGGFKRDITLSFQIVAESKAELIPMYRKLNYLASTLAPDYGNNGLMKGTLHRLTVGSYLNEMPGIITDISFDPEFDAGAEIGRKADGTYDESVGQLFKMFTVKLSFIPIHDFLPEKNKDFKNPTARYISLKNDANKDLYENFGEYRDYAEIFSTNTAPNIEIDGSDLEFVDLEDEEEEEEEEI